jgi:hypothetical protein
LRTIPWDVWTAYASVVIYALSLILIVSSLLDGMFLCAVLALPMLAVSILALAFRLSFSAANRHRMIASCLVVVCVLSFCAGSVPRCMRLHLDRKVAMAGGADFLRNWAEGIMDGCQPSQPDRRLSDDEVPLGVRTHLDGRVTANTEAVTIILGGGFFHYWVNFHRYPPGDRVTMTYDFD